MENKEITPEQILELIFLTNELNKKIDILVEQKNQLEHNFSKAKMILTDIMDFFEIHAVMSGYECKELMKKYME